jgi:hypothetical protein
MLIGLGMKALPVLVSLTKTAKTDVMAGVKTGKRIALV